MGEYKSNFSIGDHVSYRDGRSGRIIAVSFIRHGYLPAPIVNYRVFPDNGSDYIDTISEEQVTPFVVPPPII